MSIATPKTQAVADQILAHLEDALSATFPLLPKSFTRVLAKALAGVCIIFYKYAGFLFLQLFVRYASYQEVTINGRTFRPLVEWGRLIGVGDPIAASRAALNVTVTVQNQTGSLRVDEPLIYEPTGVVYRVTSAVLLNAATVTANIEAASDPDGGGGLGDIGNLLVDDVLEFATPLANVAQAVTVSAVTNTAADEEEEEAYRARVIRRFQRKAQGGGVTDYQAWGEGVDGIVAVYPYPGSNPGTTDVFVEATIESSGSDDGIPTTDQLEAVHADLLIDPVTGLFRAPINHGINVLPITRVSIGAEITGLDVAESELESVQADIAEALDDHLRSLEPFIVGLSILPRLDRALSADVQGIVSEVVRAAGGMFGTVTMTMNGGQVLAYTLKRGEKARLVATGVVYI